MRFLFLTAFANGQIGYSEVGNNEVNKFKNTEILKEFLRAELKILARENMKLQRKWSKNFEKIEIKKFLEKKFFFFEFFLSTIEKIAIPESANLDCSHDPFGNFVGVRGIGLHLDEELPFLVHVIANDRGNFSRILFKEKFFRNLQWNYPWQHNTFGTNSLLHRNRRKISFDFDQLQYKYRHRSGFRSS